MSNRLETSPSSRHLGMTDDARNRVAPDTPPVFLHSQRARSLFLSTPHPSTRLFVQAVNPQQLGLGPHGCVRCVCFLPFSILAIALQFACFSLSLSLDLYEY